MKADRRNSKLGRNWWKARWSWWSVMPSAPRGRWSAPSAASATSHTQPPPDIPRYAASWNRRLAAPSLGDGGKWPNRKNVVLSDLAALFQKLKLYTEIKRKSVLPSIYDHNPYQVIPNSLQYIHEVIQVRLKFVLLRYD